MPPPLSRIDYSPSQKPNVMKAFHTPLTLRQSIFALFNKRTVYVIQQVNSPTSSLPKGEVPSIASATWTKGQMIYIQQLDSGA